MTRHYFAAFGVVLALTAATLHAATSAVALTPERTSVEAGVTQVFSARFLNAAAQPAVGEAVQFSNDACGTFPNGAFVMNAVTDASGVASIKFTALQPGGTVCVVMAANAGATVRYQVFTYRLSQISISAAAPANLAAGSAFEMPVEVRMGSYALPNVDIAVRVVAGSGSAQVTASSGNTGSSGAVNLSVIPSGTGDYDLELSVRSLVKRVPIRFAAAAAPIHQDLWWAGVGENGWGLSIIEHRDILFILIYAYDAGGKPTWYAITSGTWNAGGTSYTGSIYAPRGTPFYAYDAARLVMGAPVGTATVTFTDVDHATLDYSIDGVPGFKSITRFGFGPPGVAPLSGRTDMWWGGLSQNGWGIAVIQQNAALFTMWYTYEANGLPTWFTMPSGEWTAADTYEGRIYRTTGSPWLGHAYDPALFKPVDVGAYRLRFAGEAATFEYTIDGRAGALPLTRTPF